tara:strand:- start:1284 stop:1850 length:567 start_codon:yes stop_codon:yes gene_type:complete
MSEIKKHLINDIVGGEDFINSISNEGFRGILIPCDSRIPTACTNIKVAYNEDNPRLVIAPVMEHKGSGNWVLAAFHSPDTDEPDAPKSNFRASLLLSLMAGTPMVVFGDVSLILSSGIETRDNVSPTKLHPVLDMPGDVSDDLMLQFESSESFCSGWIPQVAEEFGVDVPSVVESLVSGHDWKNGGSP